MIGKVIKDRRLDLNMSQRELASRMHCDVKTISEIEKGIRKKPKVYTLEKFSKVLGIKMSYLLYFSGYTKAEAIYYLEEQKKRNKYTTSFKNKDKYKRKSILDKTKKNKDIVIILILKNVSNEIIKFFESLGGRK